MDIPARLTDLPVSASAPSAPTGSSSPTRQGQKLSNDMQDGVLARILHDLDAPALSAAEWTTSWKSGLDAGSGQMIKMCPAVREYQLWREICYKDSPHCAQLAVSFPIQFGWVGHDRRDMPAMRDDNDERSELFPNELQPWRRPLAYYYLHAQLIAPWEAHSLLAEAPAASTTDNTEENASNVLTTLHRFNPALGIRTRCYWSSKGSRDQDSSEWLLLSLVHPLCLVRSISIRPFRATFQPGHPIYSSKAVRFTFSCGVRPKRFTGAAVNWDDLWEEENLWVRDYETVTETFAMQQKDELQPFTFREPILCVGGCVKVEFLGQVQKQEQDDAWYTCINYISICGKPLYGFVPAGLHSADPVKHPELLLEKVRDPLWAQGGLMKVSEGGLLLERLAVEEQGGSVTDSDDEADAVDGDGVPLFMWQALGDLGAPMPMGAAPMQADDVEP